MDGQYFRDAIANIRTKMLRGYISYDEAKIEAKPIIDEMNRRAAEVAKKYGQRHKNFTFSELMR